MEPPEHEDLARRLRELFAGVDPVPVAARTAASEALAWLDPDAALAVLIQDEALEASAASVRGQPSAARLLSFESAELTIELEIDTVDGGIRLLGQLVPAGPAEVVVEGTAGRYPTHADERGRFTTTGLPAEWLRVSVTLPPGAATGSVRRVRTEWFPF